MLGGKVGHHSFPCLPYDKKFFMNLMMIMSLFLAYWLISDSNLEKCIIILSKELNIKKLCNIKLQKEDKKWKNCKWGFITAKHEMFSWFKRFLHKIYNYVSSKISLSEISIKKYLIYIFNLVLSIQINSNNVLYFK